MTEGIDYNPLGTVTVTFDDTEYKLGRPKLRQWRYFTRRISEISEEAQEDLKRAAAELRDASDAIKASADSLDQGVLELADKELADAGLEATRAQRGARDEVWRLMYEAADEPLRQAFDEAEQTITELVGRPFFERSAELIREMFVQLGNRPLPDELDDWPSYLATDLTLPAQILAHWRQAPKASGSNGMK